MDFEAVYKKIAKKNKVSVEFVKSQMQDAVYNAFVEMKGVPIPSVEDFIIFVSTLILKNSNH